MNIKQLLGLGALSLSLLAGGALAADKDKAGKQAEILQKTQAALERFYANKPELKEATAKAPGYAVFTTYGFSFVIGGSGGSGVAHNNKTKTNTFMDVGGASVGAQIGAAQTEILFIFKSEAALNRFIENGWQAAGGATASAGASGTTAGGGKGVTANEEAEVYTRTKNGLEAGLAVGGAKFWKDKDLN